MNYTSTKWFASKIEQVKFFLQVSYTTRNTNENKMYEGMLQSDKMGMKTASAAIRLP